MTGKNPEKIIINYRQKENRLVTNKKTAELLNTYAYVFIK